MMKTSLLLIAVISPAIMLSACATSTVPMTRWTAATPDPALFAPDACPAWPEPVAGNEEVAVGYDFSAYQAYRCERATRLKAGEQARRIAEDVAKQNGAAK